MSRLYSKEELLSLYKQTIQDKEQELISLLSSGSSLASFAAFGLITPKQKEDWSVRHMDKEESRKNLISHLLEKSNVEDYIKFSKCVRQINEAEAMRIFSFIDDLIPVGLHDPIQKLQSDGMLNIASRVYSLTSCLCSIYKY